MKYYMFKKPDNPAGTLAYQWRTSSAELKSILLNGFKDAVKGNNKIQVVAEQAADWLPDKAQTAFAAMLQAHPNIKALYASGLFEDVKISQAGGHIVVTVVESAVMG